jgi:beta-galactosidase
MRLRENDRVAGFGVVFLGICLTLFGVPVWAKTIPLPPEPSPRGQKQPEFGAAQGYYTFDGKPAVIVSGSIHYPRVPRPYWRDRIRKAKAMGFNCIGTYVFWNAHEKKPGVFDFSGNLDIAAFVRVCQEEGMWVIVRPGPYVCSEWDFGGLPAWLLQDPEMVVRTGDPKFLAATDRYMKAVGAELKDLQVTHDGPILQVQVENEYGQFGRPGNEQDMAYNRAIYDQLVAAGFDTMFIRCDWPVQRTIGTAHIDEVYTTMNFGGSAQKAFAFFDREYPGLPKMCGEYWVGWFDHWGSKHHTKDLEPFLKQIDWMLSNDISFNIYMLHGGTNWGFTSGANWSGQYSADTTSYDYDAPMDETGRINQKFYAFRELITKYLPEDHVLPDPPEQIRRIEIPEFTLHETAGLEQLRGAPFRFERPAHLEAIGQTQGLAVFSTTVSLEKAGPHTLVFGALKDRAIIIVNGKRAATLDRRKKDDRVTLDLPAGPVKLDILLENMGHLNYSREMMNDRKGLGTVTLDGKEILGWEIFSFPLELSDIAGLTFGTVPQTDSPLPVFYRGQFAIRQPGDTLLDMTGWGKCMVWVNGINLGRFWDLGPQYTLYMPGCWMKTGQNEIVVMDIEPTGHRRMRGVTEHIWGLKVDKNLKYHRKPGETVLLDRRDMIYQGAFQDGDAATEVAFDRTVSARYVCIESINTHSGDNHASIAEIYLIDPAGRRMDRSGWQIIYADSEELVGEPGNADNIIDEQPVTIWHTQWQNGNPDHPHQVVIDLGKVTDIRGLIYLPRNGSNPGKIKDCRIYGRKTLFRGLKN